MEIEGPLRAYYDNKAAISVSHNPLHHDIIKHVKVDRHFIKEKVDNEILNLQHIYTLEKIANSLTKAISKPSFEKFISKLGM